MTKSKNRKNSKKRPKKKPYPALEGKTVIDRASIEAAYAVGSFRYQFHRLNDKRSRIMTCDNVGERDWLCGQVCLENPVVISHELTPKKIPTTEETICCA